MEYRQLGRSDVKVSALCLGTMTWGTQNSEAEGHEQMDYAFERGINFLDAAEMYPVPPGPETYGRTEEIIGSWMKARGNRDKVVVATKIAGPDARLTYIRDGKPRLDRANIEAALEASLKRLQTDYIDLYQLHWPERPANRFGRLGYAPATAEEDGTPLEETLAALDAMVQSGRVRMVGVSNETAWGVQRLLRLAEDGRGPRIVSIQNPYSFLNRSFEVGLAEVAVRETCGLLAYAPLGAGTLTGKYLGGAKPEGARLTLNPQNRRYQGPRAEAAIAAYRDLAAKHGLDPAQMALAYVTSRAFTTATIIGATKMAQLETNIASADLTLDAEVLDAIEEIHKDHTYPCP
ncbi:MAG: NADP(H)-dependent aldo-keto reductase [Kiloniellales bacterium]|nr:NADP(H)-dependent aldo-keto reductase [Kiloniellales bacterium]MDJ0970701.1 NADP(H)-dependent aldo-keto reductase [Kiloniellales bacterium]